jgi:hypothetical protein
MDYWLRDIDLASLTAANSRFPVMKNSVRRVAGTTSRHPACRSKILAAPAIPGDRP